MRAEPLAIEERLLRHRSASLRFEKMNSCPWKVVEPARVVAVEVREDDVGDVPRAVTELLELTHRGVRLAQPRPVKHVEEQPAETRTRMTHVLKPEPRVDEHEPITQIDDQTMTRELGARTRPTSIVGPKARGRAQRDAVEVRDPSHPTLSSGRARGARFPFPIGGSARQSDAIGRLAHARGVAPLN